MKSIIPALVFTLSLLFSIGLRAQETPFTKHYFAHLGYVSQEHSKAEIGAGVLFLQNDNVLYRLQGDALLGFPKQKVVVEPELKMDVLFNFNKDTTLQHPIYYTLGVASTARRFTPNVGISIFGILDAHVGYYFSYPQQGITPKNGVQFGFGINLPGQLLQGVFSKSKTK